MSGWRLETNCLCICWCMFWWIVIVCQRATHWGLLPHKSDPQESLPPTQRRTDGSHHKMNMKQNMMCHNYRRLTCATQNQLQSGAIRHSPCFAVVPHTLLFQNTQASVCWPWIFLVTETARSSTVCSLWFYCSQRAFRHRNFVLLPLNAQIRLNYSSYAH